MANLGFKTIKDMVGQTQCVVQCEKPLNEKTQVCFILTFIFTYVYLLVKPILCFLTLDISISQHLDFSKLLVPAHSLNDGEHFGGTEQQEFCLEDRKVMSYREHINLVNILFGINVLCKNEIFVVLQENKLIDAVQEVLKGSKKNVFMEMSIGNEERSFGTTTSYHISRQIGLIINILFSNYFS